MNASLPCPRPSGTTYSMFIQGSVYDYLLQCDTYVPCGLATKSDSFMACMGSCSSLNIEHAARVFCQGVVYSKSSPNGKNCYIYNDLFDGGKSESAVGMHMASLRGVRQASDSDVEEDVVEGTDPFTLSTSESKAATVNEPLSSSDNRTHEAYASTSTIVSGVTYSSSSAFSTIYTSNGSWLYSYYTTFTEYWSAQTIEFPIVETPAHDSADTSTDSLTWTKPHQSFESTASPVTPPSEPESPASATAPSSIPTTTSEPAIASTTVPNDHRTSTAHDAGDRSTDSTTSSMSCPKDADTIQSHTVNDQRFDFLLHCSTNPSVHQFLGTWSQSLEKCAAACASISANHFPPTVLLPCQGILFQDDADEKGHNCFLLSDIVATNSEEGKHTARLVGVEDLEDDDVGTATAAARAGAVASGVNAHSILICLGELLWVVFKIYLIIFLLALCGLAVLAVAVAVGIIDAEKLQAHAREKAARQEKGGKGVEEMEEREDEGFVVVEGEGDGGEEGEGAM